MDIIYCATKADFRQYLAFLEKQNVRYSQKDKWVVVDSTKVVFCQELNKKNPFGLEEKEKINYGIKLIRKG